MTMLVPVVEDSSCHDDSTDAEVGDGERNDVDRVFADLSRGDSMTGQKRARFQIVVGSSI